MAATIWYSARDYQTQQACSGPDVLFRRICFWHSAVATGLAAEGKACAGRAARIRDGERRKHQRSSGVISRRQSSYRREWQGYPRTQTRDRYVGGEIVRDLPNFVEITCGTTLIQTKTRTTALVCKVSILPASDDAEYIASLSRDYVVMISKRAERMLDSEKE